MTSSQKKRRTSEGMAAQEGVSREGPDATRSERADLP